MFGISNPMLAAALLGGGILVLFGVGNFLFQAGCALADVSERSYLRSLPIYSATVVLCLPLAWAIIWYAGTYEADPTAKFGTMRWAGTVAALVLTWILSALIYTVWLAAPVKKGLLIAGTEMLMMALLAALVSAVVLVVLAFVQIFSRPAPPVKSVSLPIPLVCASLPAVRP
jgi:hypothetical protein